jgi:gas vesicle protein
MDDFNRRALELDRSGSGLMLFVAGAVVGAAAALIFAPAAGRETREFLGRRSRELADDVTQQEAVG